MIQTDTHTTNQHATFSATATIVGTAIGAGIFGIPYVFAQGGVVNGLVQLVLVLAVSIVIMLAYAAVVVVTPSKHQLPGYAARYLGSAGRFTAVIALIFGMYAALSAYIIEVSFFIDTIFAEMIPVYSGIDPQWYGIAFWCISAVIIAAGASAIIRFEFIIVVAMIIVLAILAGISVPEITAVNLTTGVEWSQAFLPYGVLLFAFGAASSVPEIAAIFLSKQGSTKMKQSALQNGMHRYKWSIIAGMIVTALIYITFSLIVVGVSGTGTSESAITGLGQVIGTPALVLGALLGITTMGSSFLIIGLALQQMYVRDFSMNKYIALLLTLLPPLVFFIGKFASFIEIIGIAGALTGGLQGILIILMFHRLWKEWRRKKEKYLYIPIEKTKGILKYSRPVLLFVQLVFIAGIIYQIEQLFESFI